MTICWLMLGLEWLDENGSIVISAAIGYSLARIGWAILRRLFNVFRTRGDRPTYPLRLPARRRDHPPQPSAPTSTKKPISARLEQTFPHRRPVADSIRPARYQTTLQSSNGQDAYRRPL